MLADSTRIYSALSFLISVVLIGYFFMTRQPLVGQGLLIVEASLSHSDTPYSVGLLWTRDQSDVETSTLYHTTLTRGRHPCPRRDSSPQSQQASALDGAATGIAFWLVTIVPKYWNFPSSQRIFTRNGMSFCMLLERYGRTYRFIYPSTSTSFPTSNRAILLLLRCVFGRIINE